MKCSFFSFVWVRWKLILQINLMCEIIDLEYIEFCHQYSIAKQDEHVYR